MQAGTPTTAQTSFGTRLLLAAAIGGIVALTLGVYGSVHDPASDLAITLGFQSTITMKVWIASAALVFAIAQLITSLWMYGRLPFVGDTPEGLGWVHRISGRIAFLLTLPVAYHCLYQLGFQDTDTRVLAHSFLGCAFYGAFAAKIVIVRSRSLPGLALPVMGGLLFSILVAVWLTSALWFITNNGFPQPMSSLERIDRFLAIVCGIAVVAAVFVLLAGPEFIGADKTTKSASGGKSPAASAPDGKAIFSGNCAGCHTLSAAGSSGSVGPNLDELKPDAALVKQTVENGAGVMPSFGGKLSDAEVAAVAAFVSSSAR